MMERAFRGVWIPAEIYLDARLTPTEIYLLAEIDSRDVGDGCNADNKSLADFCKCDVRSISRYIAHLWGLGLIKVTTKNGVRTIYRLTGQSVTKEDDTPRYIPPTVEEVAAYCKERGNGIDAERFVDFYTARGWMVARGVKVHDWKALVRAWERTAKKDEKGNYMKHNYDPDKLTRALVRFDDTEE